MTLSSEMLIGGETVLKGKLNDGDKVVIRTVQQQSQTPGGLPR